MNKSHRTTKQRAAIRNAFDQHPSRALSPQEVLSMAEAEVPNIGIATVYRNIKALTGDGVLLIVRIPGQPDRYQRDADLKPHILIDLSNNKVVTFGGKTPEVKLPNGHFASRVQIIAYDLIDE